MNARHNFFALLCTIMSMKRLDSFSNQSLFQVQDTKSAVHLVNKLKREYSSKLRQEWLEDVSTHVRSFFLNEKLVPSEESVHLKKRIHTLKTAPTSLHTLLEFILILSSDLQTEVECLAMRVEIKTMYIIYDGYLIECDAFIQHMDILAGLLEVGKELLANTIPQLQGAIERKNSEEITNIFLHLQSIFNDFLRALRNTLTFSLSSLEHELEVTKRFILLEKIVSIVGDELREQGFITT